MNDFDELAVGLLITNYVTGAEIRQISTTRYKITFEALLLE
jgi:hypothetical protein